MWPGAAAGLTGSAQFSPQCLDLIWTWLSLVNEKRSSRVPSQYPPLASTQGQGSFYRRQGSAGRNQARYPPTTVLLHSHLTPSEASPIKAGGGEEEEIVPLSPGTRAKAADSTVNKEEPFVYSLLGM